MGLFKKIIASLLLWSSSTLFASVQEFAIAVTQIEYASQKIAADALYLHYYSHNPLISKEIEKTIQSLEKAFRQAAINAPDDNTKNVLEYLSFSKDKIKSSLPKSLTKEHMTQILDYCNGLQEGAESILPKTIEIPGNWQMHLYLATAFRQYLEYHLGFDSDTGKLSRTLYKIDMLSLKMDNSVQNLWKNYRLLINTQTKIPTIISYALYDLEERLGKK